MIKKFQKQLNKKGFTLVELIVVIAIIGILAAIAIPRITGFREKAETASEQSTTKVLENAAKMWLAENGNPASGTSEVWNGGAGQDWTQYLDQWPAGFTSVTIDDSGDITIAP